MSELIPTSFKALHFETNLDRRPTGGFYLPKEKERMPAEVKDWGPAKARWDL